MDALLTLTRNDPSPARQTILLVNHRTEDLEVLESILDCEHLHLLTAVSGEEGLHLLREHDVSLVLLDLQMPGMNGYQVARQMREHRKTRSIPIIFITAVLQEDTIAGRSYQSGAIDY